MERILLGKNKYVVKEKDKRKKFLLLLIEFILLGLLGLVVGIFFELLWGFLFFALFATGFYLLFRGAKDSLPILSFSIIINSLIEAVTYGFIFSTSLARVDLGVPKWRIIILSITSIISFAIPFLLKNSLIRNRKEDLKKGESKRYLYCSLALCLFLMIAFYLAAEVFLNNADEFPISFFDMLYSLLPLFLAGVILMSIISFLPSIFTDVLFASLSIIDLAGYVQFMFFNQYIGQINGDLYSWRGHVVHSLINTFVWLLIIIIGCLIAFVGKKRRILFLADCFVGTLLMVSLLFLYIKAPKESMSRKQFYLSGEEQFTVGKKENVFLLIADAIDNKMIKEMLSEESEVFDEFNDFTLYTDTCSVYDMTGLSMNQILFGYTQRKNSEHAISFMKCFAQNGYRVLFFCSEGKAVGMEEMPNLYIDNYVFSEDTNSILEIRYDKIRKGFCLITLYRVAPCLLKPLFGNFSVDFNQIVLYNGIMEELISENQKFMSQLHLQYNDKSDKCFIYQHIDGAHFPCDDYYQATKDSLKIYGEYIRQLKALGVYDNSLIIVASDHGIHDDVEGVPFPTASTPMLMIKKPNEEHSTIVLNKKPIYYQEFQASILKYAGICDDMGVLKIFGKTFDDYDESSVRTRVWFDTGFNSQKARKYTYTGDTSELERVVRDGEYEEVDSLEFDFEELD